MTKGLSLLAMIALLAVGVLSAGKIIGNGSPKRSEIALKPTGECSTGDRDCVRVAGKIIGNGSPAMTGQVAP
jgi:hypothetical protein